MLLRLFLYCKFSNENDSKFSKNDHKFCNKNYSKFSNENDSNLTNESPISLLSSGRNMSLWANPIKFWLGKYWKLMIFLLENFEVIHHANACH